jgi:hypothetical protein
MPHLGRRERRDMRPPDRAAARSRGSSTLVVQL